MGSFLLHVEVLVFGYLWSRKVVGRRPRAPLNVDATDRWGFRLGMWRQFDLKL